MEHCTLVDLLMWKDVRKSAAMFVFCLFLLTALSFYSVLTVFTCITIPFLTIMLTLRAIWVLKCAFMKESLDNPFQSWLDTDIELNGDKISKYNKCFLQFISDWAVFLRKLVLVADMMNTAKALGVLFLMYHLGNNFSGITLLFAGVLIAFTIPKIHDMYKDEINKIKQTIFDKYDNFRSRIQAFIPIGKTEKKKE